MPPEGQRWGKEHKSKLRYLLEEIYSFARVSRIYDKILLDEVQYIFYQKHWGHSEASAKAFVNNLGSTLQAPLLPTPIRLQCVCPAPPDPHPLFLHVM
jgi:hypothetical protein